MTDTPPRIVDPAAFQSLAGSLLIAMPGIDDPRFEQAVILICAHDAEHAMGLRLDQPVEGIDLADVMEKLDLSPGARTSGREVMIGGPVERQRGFVLHTDDWMLDGVSLGFGEGLAMTGTREALAAMADPVSGPGRALLALGYAGWGEGQLEEELADNVWLTAPADLVLIFERERQTLWTGALARIGVDAARLSSQGGRA